MRNREIGLQAAGARSPIVMEPSQQIVMISPITPRSWLHCQDVWRSPEYIRHALRLTHHQRRQLLHTPRHNLPIVRRLRPLIRRPKLHWP